jgi:hypothetical protein
LLDVTHQPDLKDDSPTEAIRQQSPDAGSAWHKSKRSDVGGGPESRSAGAISTRLTLRQHRRGVYDRCPAN